MESKLTGRVHKYGDNINTDIISPPAYMELSIFEAAKYTMYPVDPTFSQKFKTGDILVAENNFGSGSSRETAPLCLKELGVKLILAKSFARIFYRNAINLGILALECGETDKIADGDRLEVNFEAGTVKNLTRDQVYQCPKMSPPILRLVQLGGLLPFLEAYQRER